MLITSTQNPKVKEVVQLHQKKYRETLGRILIEGRHPVEEAQKAGLILETLYLREGETMNASCEVVEVTEAVMGKISTTDSPPPMVAVARKPQPASENLLDMPAAFLLGLVDLQDPGNFGTLTRSACAFGVTGLLSIGSVVEPYNPKVIRASAGLIFRLPILMLPDLKHLQTHLQGHSQYTLWGADAHQGKAYHQVQFSRPCILLMGSEAHGLPASTWEMAQPLHIPMTPDTESLNVGIAGSILLAQAFQQSY